jgi:hypothetical protein
MNNLINQNEVLQQQRQQLQRRLDAQKKTMDRQLAKVIADAEAGQLPVPPGRGLSTGINSQDVHDPLVDVEHKQR